jgi:hypothetical protein
MQTSVFNIPICPVISGQNIIDDINCSENMFLLAPMDSIDFTERGITIYGKFYESFVEVSLDDMMEIEQRYPLHTLGEEHDRKCGEPSAEPDKEKDFPGFPVFDFDDKITERDIMVFELSRSFTTTTKDYASSFSKVGHIYLLVENNKTDMGFVTVDTIIKSLVKHMMMSNKGLCHTWTYRKRECYAILDWCGCWGLYTIAPMKYIEEEKSYTYNNLPINFMVWDDNNYMYKVMLDMKTDVMLPILETYVERPRSTFKDLSYCKAYVNMFVDGINHVY